MYSTYQEQEELEDDLYQEDEDDSSGSEANSELEFRLYSQLHYSSNAGDMVDLENGEEEEEEEGSGQEGQQLQQAEKTADVNAEQEHTGESSAPSPCVGSFVQHLKKKNGVKLHKQKKGTSRPKGQRSVFEEVIVIDSGPDVISISEDDTGDDDDDDDEEGICALKGRGAKRPQTSTPASQRTPEREKAPAVPVTVDSSSSESDSEESESESESESDGLENWMMLGPGTQDGDNSIKLNLEGGSDSNTDAEGDERVWVVSGKDKEAQIYNKDKGARIVFHRLSNRYYTDKSVECRNCNKKGHLSKNCPESKKLSPCFICGNPGHPSSECPSKPCKNCGIPGHVFETCNERPYWHKQCHRCSMKGHFFSACPEIWRQYHITTKTGAPAKRRRADQGRTPAYCYNCSSKGHFGHACGQRRMFNGTFASTPFINHYDSLEDNNRIQHTTKLKIEELKKKGLFLPGSPLTPGPPTKRQKNSFNSYGHHTPNLNHTPRQSPHSQKPSRSHIFFNDDHDSTPAPSKTHKYNKNKQRESPGNVKPWKPKRPVPTKRDTPTKLILDDAQDFPRGGGRGGNLEMKKRKMMNKVKPVPAVSPGGRKDRRVTVTAEMQGSKSKQKTGEKNKRSRRCKAQRNADREAQMYPTDENLFIIKQRKRRSR